MAGTRKSKQAPPPAKRKPSSGEAEWTHGLKKLYDSVVDEPLPDSFQELLSKLDSGE